MSTCLHEAADRWVLGLLDEDELPSIAMDALEASLDSPKLRMLAGWVPGWNFERRQLFFDALDELRVPLDTPADVRRRRVLPILESFLADRMHVASLADALAERLGRTLLAPGQPMYSLYCYAADYLDQDDIPLQHLFEDMAKSEARRLLNERR